MSVLKKIYEVFNKRQRFHSVILFVVMFIGGFAELLGVSAIVPLINVVMDPSVIETNEKYAFIYNLFNMTSVRQFVLFVSIGLIFVYIGKNLFVLEMYNLQYRFTHNNQRRLACRIMDCYMHQSYLFHISRNTAELQRNVTGDVSNFFSTVLYLMEMCSEIIVCGMLVVYLMITDWMTTLGVFSLVAVFGLIFFVIYRPIMTAGGKYHRELNGTLIKWINQSLGGIKEIKILNREDYFLNVVDRTYDKTMRIMRRQRIINMLPKPLMETLCICSLLVAIIIKVYSGVNLTSFMTTLSVFALAAFRMLPSFNRITTNLGNIMYSRASVDAIYDELKRMENLDETYVEIKATDVEIPYEKGITLDKLEFRYPGTDSDVIKGIDLFIPKNKSVAFIGPSGSGKTTLVDLILGVLAPTGGKILSDDVDINENIVAWHDKLGYIPQSIYLMDDTIRKNISFGVPDSEVNEEQIMAAVKDAQLEEFIASLPEGLDTQIGEKGVRLSGGQRQRIGIARTLYNNPEILVMDEATSALDNETEIGVMEAVSHLAGTKTMIMVAHRLTTIVNCDIIYEVDKGKLRQVSREEIVRRINNGGKEEV